MRADELRDAVAAIEGVTESPSRFKDDLAYWVNGTEILHFEPDGTVDIRLTRAIIAEHRAELRADPAVTLRGHSADWVTVAVTDPAGAARALELAGWAAAAHRAPAGTVGRPPSSGRRRR